MSLAFRKALAQRRRLSPSPLWFPAMKDEGDSGPFQVSAKTFATATAKEYTEYTFAQTDKTSPLQAVSKKVATICSGYNQNLKKKTHRRGRCQEAKSASDFADILAQM